MSVTSNDIANEALQFIGDNVPPVQGQSPTWDSSPAGLALQKLYLPAVQTVGMQWGWDFARNSYALVASGNVAPSGWTYEYLYPPSGVEVWQVMPASLPDPNNPLPTNWSIGNTLVSGVQTKVIWANQAAAVAIYNNSPAESTWNPLFREAVVRLLASELAMALFGRPDTEASLLQSGAAFENIGEGRPD